MSEYEDDDGWGVLLGDDDRIKDDAHRNIAKRHPIFTTLVIAGMVALIVDVGSYYQTKSDLSGKSQDEITQLREAVNNQPWWYNKIPIEHGYAKAVSDTSQPIVIHQAIDTMNQYRKDFHRKKSFP